MYKSNNGNKVGGGYDNQGYFSEKQYPDKMRKRHNSVGTESGSIQFRKQYGEGLETNEDNVGCASLITFFAYLLIFLTLPFTIWGCIKVVQEYERAVIFRIGRIKAGGAKGPGLFFIIPCIDTFRLIDLRLGAFDVPPQEILTRDSVTVSVDAVVYYQVSDPQSAVCNNDDYDRSTRLLAATTLRNILGTRNLSEILSERESIGIAMHRNLEEAASQWGVHVDRVEIKDVRLPSQMQRAMAAEAEASREARAKVIASEGEQKSSKALAAAADVMTLHPAALQLRYLQTLHSISAEDNSTIIFPLPMELISKMLGRETAGLRKRYTNTTQSTINPDE